LGLPADATGEVGLPDYNNKIKNGQAGWAILLTHQPRPQASGFEL